MFLLSALFACAFEHEGSIADPVAPDVGVATSFQDIRCTGAPAAGAKGDWRHLSSHLVSELGEPRHRGVDLIASTEDATQIISGKITYSSVEKDLEDEDVELFACIERAGSAGPRSGADGGAEVINARWAPIGGARTNGDGRFALSLSGDQRLPAGMRDLYASVSGDRTGTEYIAFVAPPGTPIIASDVDGTLTASENEYPKYLVVGGDVAVQTGAAEALTSVVPRGVSVIYLSARGDRFTDDTRDWLAANHFPRGPVRLPTSIVTLPGADTIEFKSRALAELAPFDLIAGFGNRATDVTAYMNAGLAHERIFIKLPEFTDELAGDLTAGHAFGFDQYDAVRTTHLPPLMP